MRRWLSTKTFLLLIGLVLTTHTKGQQWVIDISGLDPNQENPSYRNVQFKGEGPLGKDWIYGLFLDEFGVRRVAAFRENGKWNSLPFRVPQGGFVSMASDIFMYGDTLYLVGNFNVIRDVDNMNLGYTNIVKVYNDSVWVSPSSGILESGDASGDSLLLSGEMVIPNFSLYPFSITYNRGQSWQYPFSTFHPTNALNFGAHLKARFFNGDIVVIDNGTSPGQLFRGLSRWDGQQWHPFGEGIFGNNKVWDFEIYQNEIYMGGSFHKMFDPRNPGNCIARWYGQQWHNVANGLNGFVSELFVYKEVLFCVQSADSFGDVSIPRFAGWNGQQWCGTPMQWGTQLPSNFGFIQDTLYAYFRIPTTVNGDSVSFIAKYTGNYLTDGICSTLGLGTEEPASTGQQFVLFPNPATDVIKLECKYGASNVVIRAFNVLGIEVFQIQFQEMIDSQVLELSTDHLSPGHYWMTIESDKGMATECFIIK